MATKDVKNTQYGKCRLCDDEADLRESHLLPRGISVLLHRRAKGLANPRPLLIWDTYVGQSQSQLKDYLLCNGCEQRFSKKGEAWVLANCLRDNKTFPLRQRLLETPVLFDFPDLRIKAYSAAQVPKIDCEKLIYFALSVFWRAAVHRWHIRETPMAVKIELGRYEQPIRQYLLGKTPFPQSITLSVRVASPDVYTGSVMAPASIRENGWHAHKFTIPGIDFTLHVGAKIPTAIQHSAFATNKYKLIIIAPIMDERALEFAHRQVLMATRKQS